MYWIIDTKVDALVKEIQESAAMNEIERISGRSKNGENIMDVYNAVESLQNGKQIDAMLSLRSPHQ